MYHLAKGLYRLATSKEEFSVILLGLDNAGKTTFHEQAKSLFLPEHPDPKLRTVPTVGQNVSTLTLPDMYLKIWDVGGQLSLRRLWQSYYASCHAIIFILDSTDIGDGELTLGGDEDEEEDEGESDREEDDADSSAKTNNHNNLAPGGTSTLGAGRNKGKDGGSRRPSARRGRGASSSRAARTGGSGVSEGRLDECRAVLEDVLQNSETEGVPLLILANKQDREDCVEVVRIKEGLVKKVFEGEKASSIRDSRVLPVSALTGTGVREAIDWVRSRVKWNTESRPPVMR